MSELRTNRSYEGVRNSWLYEPKSDRECCLHVSMAILIGDKVGIKSVTCVRTTVLNQIL